MKSILFFLFISIGSILHAQTYKELLDCIMHSDITKDELVQFTLSLSHNEPCEFMGIVSKVDKLISLAISKLGTSYVPTEAGPDHFDCSGFVYYIFTANDISIPRSSLDQSKSGKKLVREELEKGDILFFDTYQKNHINHSGIYLGDGKFIHSTSGKAYGVTISDLDKGFYLDKFRWGIQKIESGLK